MSALEECIDFEDTKNSQTLAAETFKVQLNFDFDTHICFKLLEMLIYANQEFLESTQIDDVIDFVYHKNKPRFLIQNVLYIAQAICVTIHVFEPAFLGLVIVMTVLAGIIIFIELVQTLHDVRGYLSNPFNWLESGGNILVILLAWEVIPERFTWIMILLILFKAVLTLKIFKAQRTLIQMILECINGMIPFLTIVSLSVFSFALTKYSLDKEDENNKGFGSNLAT